MRGALLGLVGLLYLISIPWYRAPDPAPASLWGLPDWVAVAVVCYGLAAVVNAVAWWITGVDDGDPPDSA